MEKVQNRYHFNMLVSAVRRETLKAFLMDVRAMVAMDSLPQDVRFAIEVDPINMY
jgi:primosomal protein N' (replication factor Y)